MKWTDEQLAYLEAIREGKGNVMLQALAGTGKSTTIAEAGRIFREKKRRSPMVYLVFGRAAKEDLSRKVGGLAEVRTYASWGWAICRDKINNLRYSPEGFLIQHIRDTYPKMSGNAVLIRDVLQWCMNTGVDPQDKPLINRIAIAVAAGEGVADKPGMAAICVKLLQALGEKKWVRKYGAEHEHSAWLPYLYSWAPELPFSMGHIDEGQDTNKTQMWLARSCAQRVSAVGDPNQSIYMWRGAHPGAFRELQRELGAEQYPLTLTFRCAQQIAQRAALLVPGFRTARDENGTVKDIDVMQLGTLLKAGDAVVSRKNSYLIPAWAALVKREIPVRVLGKDLAGPLKKLLNSTHEDSLYRAAQVAEGPLRRAIMESQEAGASDKARLKQDQHDTLSALRANLPDMSLDEFYRMLARVVPKEGDSAKRYVSLTTVHQAKGLEWPRVFVMRNSFRAKLSNTQEEGVQQEEVNLLYVAVTRAISELYNVF